MTTPEAIAVLKRRLDHLPETPDDWQTRGEKDALRYLIGEPGSKKRSGRMKRFITHRINWLEARCAIHAHVGHVATFDERELAALKHLGSITGILPSGGE